MSERNPAGEPWWGNAMTLQTFGTQSKSDTQQILEAIAALAAGLQARDRQLSAISEQVRDGNAEILKQIGLEGEGAEATFFEVKQSRDDLAKLMNVIFSDLLEQINQEKIEANSRFKALADGQERLETALKGLKGELDGFVQAEAVWHEKTWKLLAAVPKQKLTHRMVIEQNKALGGQRRKGKRK